LEIGDQVQEEWIRPNGFYYDSREDKIHISISESDHIISKPRVILLNENGAMVSSISIQDAGFQLHTVQFRQPLQLQGMNPKQNSFSIKDNKKDSSHNRDLR
jgi:hypothetical protein